MQTQTQAQSQAQSQTQDDDSAAAPTPGTVLCEDGLRRPPWAARDPLLREYYDTEWGVPVRDEAGLFERLVLEGFQSGLSWVTILRKRPAFREAFAGFSPDAVAAFTEDDVARLMADERIVRNRRKIDAAIANARAVVALRSEGGLGELIWSYRPETTPRPRTMDEVPSRSPESEALAKELKRRGFSFVGPVTIFALMEAIGVVDTHLVDSHRRGSSGVWTGGASTPEGAG
ncbi:DNA-3-methyladenine glycosylase I [uncultured Dietzia sp.]|uniref:DNA-3-methyladenine glycosylase I n=1 Tax=uncultured Dietzia sp. TaxID=395519 RepID=UPI0030FA647B